MGQADVARIRWTDWISAPTLTGQVLNPRGYYYEGSFKEEINYRAYVEGPHSQYCGANQGALARTHFKTLKSSHPMPLPGMGTWDGNT